MEENNNFNNNGYSNTNVNTSANTGNQNSNADSYKEFVEQKKTKREMFIGMNLINKIGVLFVVIGAIAFSQMPGVPDIVKTILIFALGGAMLLVGELMNRKKPDIFSHGITGGGTAVIYAAIAVGYFTMHTINELFAFVLCFVLTAAVFMLANRYNSQTILALSLIGGFIPVFVLQSNPTYIYGAMVYFLILNSTALLMSFHKKWTAVSFIVLILNIFANALIIFFSFSTSGGLFNLSFNCLINPFALTAYIAISHLICAAIPVISTIRAKASITAKDISIVVVNAVASTMGLIASFVVCEWDDYFGALFIALAAAYAGFAAITALFFGDKSGISRTLGGFAAAFAVLFCPAQFEDTMAIAGLAVVSGLIIIVGILINNSFYNIFGAVSGSLTFCILFRSMLTDECFWFNYLVFSVMLGAIVVTACLRGLGENGFVKCFKYIALVNIWVYSIYAILFKLAEVAERTGNSFVCGYLVPCSAILATFIAAFIYGKVKKDFFRVFSMILYILAILFYFGLQLTATPAALDLDGTWYTVMLALSIGMNIVSVFVVYDLAKTFNSMANGKGQLLPLIISGYMLISSTATLSAFDSATITNWILSVVYILMAFAWIWFGFRRNNVIMRRFGLGLALLASAKLFFIDLSTYSDVFRTVSWFAFGIVLIGISYLYKLFGKKLSERLEAEKNENVQQ